MSKLVVNIVLETSTVHLAEDLADIGDALSSPVSDSGSADDGSDVPPLPSYDGSDTNGNGSQSDPTTSSTPEAPNAPQPAPSPAPTPQPAPTSAQLLGR